MNNPKDDDSSESENEFLVSPNEINLDLTFFKSKNKKSVLCTNDIYENSDDSHEFNNVNDNNSVEIFSQVLKNLENTKMICLHNEAIDKRHTEIATSMKQNQYFELLLEGESNKLELSDTSENENLDDAINSTNYITPKEGIQITLPSTSQIFKKKTKNKQDLSTIIENQIKHKLRTTQIFIHKVGILCWLAHGFHINKVINDTEIMSLSLSLISVENYPKNRSDLTYLEKFIKWFKKIFTVKNNIEEEDITKEALLQRLQRRQVLNNKELVLVCIAMLRAIGMNCRLIISLCPPPLKLQLGQLFRSNQKGAKNKKKSISNKPIKDEEKTQKTASVQNKVIIKNNGISKKNAQLIAKQKAAVILNTKPTGNKETKGKTYKVTTHKEVITKSNTNQLEISSNSQNKTKKLVNKNEIASKDMSRRLRTRNQIKSPIDNNSSVALSHREEEHDVSLLKNSQKKNIIRTCIKKENENSEFEDSEGELNPKKKRNILQNKKSLKSTNKTEKYNMLSSDDETNISQNNKESENFWLEVYLESEENWISVNIIDEKVHCVSELYKKAGNPVLYIIAWNIDGTIKDVTRRYCSHWLTVTRKQRIDEDWLKETLYPWKEKETLMSQLEDKLLAQKELEQPLPKTISDCKSHPLYVLARHLLKYEALYPPDCVPLGYLQNGEAIYSRHCVHVLSSRETWIRKARVVKPNQEPYKVVKALPKYDKLSKVKLADRTLELFGEWQTTEYIPPEAKDGIVPRNEYGNVDLFKQSMLPKGTVHIDLPGLNRIARKLNIDCAPAVIGFKFGCMGALPAFEGFVVCAEYEDTLREAWEAEQVEVIKRSREKMYKRIYGNWKKLIDGLCIKEKLAGKYEFETERKPTVTNKRTKQKTSDGKRLKMI